VSILLRSAIPFSTLRTSKGERIQDLDCHFGLRRHAVRRADRSHSLPAVRALIRPYRSSDLRKGVASAPSPGGVFHHDALSDEVLDIAQRRVSAPHSFCDVPAAVPPLSNRHSSWCA
jgi:hypothetical protein